MLYNDMLNTAKIIPTVFANRLVRHTVKTVVFGSKCKANLVNS